VASKRRLSIAGKGGCEIMPPRLLSTDSKEKKKYEMENEPELSYFLEHRMGTMLGAFNVALLPFGNGRFEED